MLDVDFNHPMSGSGRTLIFDIKVEHVGDATAEENAHRHVHGPGGVSHSGHSNG